MRVMYLRLRIVVYMSLGDASLTQLRELRVLQLLDDRRSLDSVRSILLRVLAFIKYTASHPHILLVGAVEHIVTEPGFVHLRNEVLHRRRSGTIQIDAE